MPHLIVDKEYKGYKILQFSDRLAIGRGKGNDIVLKSRDHTIISRDHACVTKENDAYFLKDTSKNGTYINGRKIKNIPLKNGVRFEIAEFGFTFVDDSAISPLHEPTIGLGSLDPLETFFLQADPTEADRESTLKEKLAKAGIIAVTESMISLYKDIEEVAQVNVPVLILGEPGTGKEKIAETIHNFSGALGSFLPLNCSSIPEGIFESELFGSVKGAFHNATDKPGKIEMADNGTLFLDEIGDMGLELQPKLLRFMEDKKITRLGDNRIREVNVRLVAATNQDLQTMMAERRFREDLFQRLACITLHIPPLRERKKDILPLAQFFIEQFTAEHNLPPYHITDDGKRALLSHPWPGNVRELANTLLSTMIRDKSGMISAASLSVGNSGQQETVYKSEQSFPTLEEMEKQHIAAALERVNGNKQKAARLLKISRDTLYNKIKKYGL